ncbi:MAG: adenosylmethionine decarboxylase [Candidatus Micrarchaeia archaeon]
MRRGTHVLLELFGCDKFLLEDISFIKKVYKEAIKESGLCEIKNSFKLHKFNPLGLTFVSLLKTSHISFHTWPEKNYACLDIFACDEAKKVYKAEKVFLKNLKPKRVKRIVLKRGFISYQ